MTGDTRTFLAAYVIWHPDVVYNKRLAERIYDHYRRSLFVHVGGSSGLDVLFRSEAAAAHRTPLLVPLDAAHATSIIILLDDELAADADYVQYVRVLIMAADTAGFTARVMVVSMTETAQKKLGPDVQTMRWYAWDGLTQDEKEERLLTEVTYLMCRTLRHYIEQHHAQDLGAYLEPFRIFFSHSKWDSGNEGEEIAKLIRDRINARSDLATFFDVVNIPPGTRFAQVLQHYVRNSAIVAIQTDTFASREWCRREILEAKLHDRPMIVAHCVSDGEERGFPYLGNVPLIRMDAGARHKVGRIICRLLDELLAQLLWQCRIAGFSDAKVRFVSRQPELLALVGRGTSTVVVHPDPPLGSEEIALFQECAPTLLVLSFTQWVALA